jgi:hypothetical protein
MSKKSQAAGDREKEASKRTPTFLLELPLQVSVGQAARLRAHLEAGRQFYNAVFSEGLKRLRRMRADPAWQVASATPRGHSHERNAAFIRLREQYGFSEYALQQSGKALRVNWLAEHLDAVLAQTLASRAYRALNRVCVGVARRVRFKSRGRGLSSIENKRNDTGLRFVLEPPEEGNQGYLLWKDDQLLAVIDRKDPVVKYGLDHRVKYARLVQRRASSPKAAGTDAQGFRYVVQLALEGMPYQKPKHTVGSDMIGADLGPSSATRSRIQNCFMLPKRSSETYCSTSSTLGRRSGEATSRCRSPLTTFLSQMTAHRTARRNECLLASKRIRSQGEWYGQHM